MAGVMLSLNPIRISTTLQIHKARQVAIEHVNGHVDEHVNKHVNGHVNEHVKGHVNGHVDEESSHFSRRCYAF